ncbi:MAG: hypothetical protein EXR79_03675 [Myxococcales bacterium]|nr:hypothetical protein [Myxococcales bacterium]
MATAGTPAQIDLIASGRCPACAELRPTWTLLRGHPCPRCGVAGSDDPAALDTLHRAIGERLARRRPWIYGPVCVGALLTGPLPLLASLVTLVGLLVGRHTLVRAALPWLSPRRRVCTRFTLRLWLMVAALVALVAHEVLTLVPVVGPFLKVGVALGTTALYIEGALGFVAGRLRKDGRSTDLDAWEWLVPVGLLGTFVAAGGFGVLATLWAWDQLDAAGGWVAGLVRGWLEN